MNEQTQEGALSPPAKASSRPYKLLRRTSTVVADTSSDGDQLTKRSRKQQQQRAFQGDDGDDAPANDEPGLSSTDSREEDQSWSSRVRKNPRKMAYSIYNNLKARNVFKASLAYLIASLVVYTPFGRVYGVSDNKHMVATIATYFNPARTSGSMTEATMFTGFAVAYSFTLSILSMLTSALFNSWDMREVGYIIDIFVFCGGGIGSIIFMKQHVDTPNFTTACTVACISLIVILTREGNVQAGQLSFSKLIQNFSLVGSGLVVSTTLCYLVWPQSALSELKKTLNKSLGLYSEMLGNLTETFLAGGNVQSPQFQEMSNNMSTYFKSLEKHISDVKYELYIRGREREHVLLRRMVASCHRLASHMSGLTSSVQVQYHLLQEDDSSSDDDDDNSSVSEGSVVSLEELSSRMSSGHLSAVEETTTTHQMSTDLYRLFVYHLGPPLRSFSHTLRGIMDTIPFESVSNFDVSLDNKARSSLQRASCSFSMARASALKSLYNQDIFKTRNDFETMADEEGIAASCGNFSYVLEAFGMELEHFISILEEYDQVVKLDLSRTYDWLKIWGGHRNKDGYEPLLDDEEEDDEEAIMNLHKSTFYEPKVTAPRTWGYKMWRSMRVFRRTDVQFGIKVGIGAALFAIPAFLDHIRPVFGRWRGEWGLITYSIIMAKSIGGTLKTVRIRIGGTLIGAITAYLTWYMFPRNPYMLAFVGWLMALPCFYMILYWKTNQPFGRFILLTYNITALYSYSLSYNDNEDDDDEGGAHPIVGDIAFHRFVSVTVGTLWALLVTVLFWPNSARRQFKNVLSVQWMRMGLVWKLDPLTAEHHQVRGIKGEHELKSTMIELRSLLSQATEELRVKGPYPEKEYKQVLQSTQTILDMYQNMSVLVAKFRKPSKREVAMIEYTSSERKEICSRIFLFFYLVSSAVKVGFPLPDKLPSTEHAIDRMLAKLNEYRQESIDDQGDDEDFVLFYSYILATIMIAEELAKIAIVIQKLYGVIEDEMLEVQ